MSVATLEENRCTPRDTPSNDRSQATIEKSLSPRDANETRTATGGEATSGDTVSYPSEGASGWPSPPVGYQIKQSLGRGGMGEVYLAWDQVAERMVAMKFLRADGATARERFQVEVRALALIEHPNVVRVVATGFDRDDPYFTLEYVPGGTLAKRIEADGPMAAADAARLMSAVAAGVQAAHGKGVLHRDLKPSNILLGADGTPKISDFGLAKRLDRDDGITMNPGAMGTPGFMPPEQVEGSNVGFTADVYGLGATLYHLLTGHAPFTGKSREEILRRVRDDLPARPRTLNAVIPPALEGIVLKALEKNPKHRYATAAAFADDLNQFAVQKRTIAPAATRYWRMRQWGCHHRRRVAFALIACTIALGLVAVGSRLGVRGQQDDALQPVVEPGEAVRRELQAGREVDLLDAAGKPKHTRIHLEPITLGELPGERGFMFQAFHFALVELIDDPGLTTYRVKLKLRHLDINNRGAVDPFDRDYIGFYFGHSLAELPDKSSVHQLSAVTYSESDGKAIVEQRPAGSQSCYLRQIVATQSPDRLTYLSSLKAAAVKFTPLRPIPPGVWRQVQLDVSPAGVKMKWEAIPGTMSELIEWDLPKLQAQYAKLHRTATDRNPAAAERLPNWSPRLPIGIVSFKGVAAVRDVTIEP